MTRRRVGWLSILVGAGLALGVQVLAPVRVPLYDGVVVQEPYRFLQAGPGQVGEPASGSDAEPVAGGVSPTIVAATTESPPQAQLITQLDAFEIGTGIASITATVTPIEPPAVPPDGTIAGNVYRFAVTDEAGNQLAPKPCDGCRSLVLRAPENTGEARIMRFGGGVWTEVDTLHAGLVAMYQTNADAMGDYAVVERVGAAGASEDLRFLVIGGGIAVIFAAFIGLMVIRARPPRPPTSRPGRVGATGRPVVPSRIPSKRRGPKRPPSGRSQQ